MKYLLLVDTVWLLVLQHIKPLAAVGFVAVNVEYVPVESTVIKLPFPTKGGLLCQIRNGLKLKYKYLDSKFFDKILEVNSWKNIFSL